MQSCHTMLYLTGGYRPWESWHTTCKYIFTEESSPILSDTYLPNFGYVDRLFGFKSAIVCKFKIVRPVGDVIIVMWRAFLLGGKIGYVKVRYSMRYLYAVDLKKLKIPQIWIRIYFAKANRTHWVSESLIGYGFAAFDISTIFTTLLAAALINCT